MPVNTRFKGTEAAVRPRAERRPRAVHGPRVPRHRLSGLARRHRRAAPLARATRSCCPARAATARSRWAEFLARGDTRHRRRRSTTRVAALGPDDPSDIVFTSGTDRQPEGRRDDPRPDAARLPRLVRLGRSARRRPLPHRQPVLPHLRLQGRRARVADPRRHDLPARGVRPGGGVRPRRTRAHHGAPRRADAVPVAARLIRTGAQHDISSLRLAVTGAADIPVELIRRVREELPFERILTGYGLTEAGTVTGSRPDDDFEHIAGTVGRAVARLRGAHRRPSGRRHDARRARRGDRARRDRDARLPRRSRGHGGGDRRRRLPAHRRPRHVRRRRLPAHRRPDQGHVHRRRVQRLSRPRSRTCCSRTRASRRSR